MDAKALTVQYVSKYVQLLNQLQDNKNALAPLMVSILCSQRNEYSEAESKNVERQCPNCLIPWKNGNLTVKTLPVRLNKNKKTKKYHTSVKPSFKVVMKCLVCLNLTSSVFTKNKVLNDKSTVNISKKSTSVKNICETPGVKEEKLDIICKRKPKKKKRNLYAGLNPLVFKNIDLCKKKMKNSVSL